MSWSCQWVTFHLTLKATHCDPSYSASFTALIATNLAGFLQITPGNVGVMQGSMVLALLPFDIAPETAVAAGLCFVGAVRAGRVMSTP